MADRYDYPLVQTGEVTDISDTGAVFHASIFQTGRTGISAYGFVWGMEESPDISSSKLLIAGPAGPGIQYSPRYFK